MNNKKRVCPLYRVSTLGQVDHDDIPMQKECCRDFVAQHSDWVIQREFFEKGVSGFKTSAKDWDAIQELQKMALRGEFDVLLVYMFDRLGRRDDETPFIVEWFVRSGIEVWSVKEGQRRFDNHVDKLLNYITFWQASGESIKTSIRTKTRMEQLTAEGNYTGGVPSYGYKLVHNGRMNKRNREVYDLAIDEEAAKIIQLIFHKYVHEGYGAQRICRYLADNFIRKADGGDFPNTTINRILKNRMYLGIIHNGEAESKIIPELQIIDPETFEEAQKLMAARTTRHSETPLNMSGHALMKGNIYCGHCGNRLTLATSGHKRRGGDGRLHRVTRFRYQCHYGVRHPHDCDGQSAYSVDKLDAIVERVMLYQLGRIRASDGRQSVQAAHRARRAQARSWHGQVQKQLAERRAELADYQNEILKVIRGQSSFTQEVLAPLIQQAQSEVDALSAELDKAQAKLDSCEEDTSDELKEYTQLQTWADLYKTCSFDEKKVIVSRFIKKLTVRRDYRIEVEFNVSFEDYKTLVVESDAKGRPVPLGA